MNYYWFLLFFGSFWLCKCLQVNSGVSSVMPLFLLWEILFWSVFLFLKKYHFLEVYKVLDEILKSARNCNFEILHPFTEKFKNCKNRIFNFFVIKSVKLKWDLNCFAWLYTNFHEFCRLFYGKAQKLRMQKFCKKIRQIEVRFVLLS